VNRKGNENNRAKKVDIAVLGQNKREDIPYNQVRWSWAMGRTKPRARHNQI